MSFEKEKGDEIMEEMTQKINGEVLKKVDSVPGVHVRRVCETEERELVGEELEEESEENKGRAKGRGKVEGSRGSGGNERKKVKG